MNCMHAIKEREYECCLVKNLKAGQVLYEDIIVEDNVLIKKGEIVTEQTIYILNILNIQSVCVVKENVQSAPQKLNLSTEKRLTNISKELQNEFYKIIGFLSSETRYGKVLKNKEDVYYVKNLFLHYMNNPIYYHFLLKFKELDEYSYYHIIDVFTLCTLFCRKEGIPNVEDIAIGFLFHDIGKLYTPVELLRKKGRLTKKEALIVQEHTEKGYNLLRQIGLERVAYLAKSHHERFDGSGYPEGLSGEELPKELQILQLIDRYSVITLRRSYKEIVAASHAIGLLYNDLHFYNKDLLNRFIDFIGIYPENSVVLLSDGSQAIVEKVNCNYPLLTVVKLFKNNETIILPIDLSITIQKILFYHINTPNELFSEFSDFLISEDFFQIESYHSKLKSQYEKHEWFTHIYLPIFQVFLILNSYNTFPTNKMQQVCQKLLKLLDEALLEFRLSSDEHNKTLLIVNGQFKSPALYKLFEGLLHSDDIYSYIILNPENDSKLQDMIHSYEIENIIILGKPLEIQFTGNVTKYHLTELQVESLLNRFVCTNLRKIKLRKALKQFKED